MEQLALQRFAEAEQQENESAKPAAGAAAGEKDGTGEDGSQDQAAAFRSMIEGEYKDAYEAAVRQRIQAAIQQRFRNNQDLQRQLEEYRPIMEALGEQYGADGADAKEIALRMRAENRARSDLRGRKGTPAVSEGERTVKDHFSQLVRQGEELKRAFPGFDLMEELQNPSFLKMTAPGSGISVKDAFYALHGEEIQKESMQYAARQAGKMIAASVQAGASRPVENGMQRPNPVTMSVDIRGMDPRVRDEFRRRIRNGEQINFRDKM